MKKITLMIALSALLVTNSILAESQTSHQNQREIQTAREGCQKPLGFLPTPSKLQCMLTAFGLSQNEVKPKSLAIIYQVCHGRTLQPQPSNIKLKKYQTLGSCLNDPVAITIMNKELTSEGFQPIKINNPAVLTEYK